jgi:hypothetical protein
MIFGPSLHGADFRILLQSDSLVSVDTIKDTAKSPMLTYLHQVLLARPEVQRLGGLTDVGQVYGEGNTITDHGSRGRLQLLLDTCEQLGVQTVQLPVPEAFVRLINCAVEAAQKTE